MVAETEEMNGLVKGVELPAVRQGRNEVIASSEDLQQIRRILRHLVEIGLRRPAARPAYAPAEFPLVTPAPRDSFSYQLELSISF